MLFLLHLGKRFTSETQGQVLRRVITPHSLHNTTEGYTRWCISLCCILWLAREG